MHRVIQYVCLSSVRACKVLTMCGMFGWVSMQLTPHDVVNIKLNKGDSNSPSLGQGTVYRIKVCKILPSTLSDVSAFHLFAGADDFCMDLVH